MGWFTAKLALPHGRGHEGTKGQGRDGRVRWRGGERACAAGTTERGISIAVYIFFWLCVSALAYTFVGYGLLMFVLAWLKSALARTGSATPSAATDLEGEQPAGAEAGTREPPSVCVVVVVRDEEKRIADRVRNVLGCDYPPDRLCVVVVSDGSTDGTVESVRALGDGRVDVVALRERGGKAGGINAGLHGRPEEVIVFADARQRFASDTVARLVAPFADPAVGAVSGSLEVGTEGDAVSGGVDVYWRMEKAIRHAESQVGSAIGCTGAVYAIRRELFEPLPEDTILDDVVVPMRILVKGYRVLFEPAAKAFDPQPFSPEKEHARKRRTLAGNYQMLFRYPRWLLPWRNRVWWQLISHKYMRLAGPWLMVVALVSNGLLAGVPVYRALVCGQLTFYLAALAGMKVRTTTSKLFSLPAGFVFLNAQAAYALIDYLRGSFRKGWG